jgi:hypothetical protein
MRKRDHLEDPGVDEMILQWTELIWLRTGTGGGLL